jgi:hypothetical protein
MGEVPLYKAGVVLKSIYHSSAISELDLMTAHTASRHPRGVLDTVRTECRKGPSRDEVGAMAPTSSRRGLFLHLVLTYTPKSVGHSHLVREWYWTLASRPKARRFATLLSRKAGPRGLEACGRTAGLGGLGQRARESERERERENER